MNISYLVHQIDTNLYSFIIYVDNKAFASGFRIDYQEVLEAIDRLLGEANEYVIGLLK